MMKKSKTLKCGLSLLLMLLLCASIAMPTALAADTSGATGGDTGTSIALGDANDPASSDETTAEEETEPVLEEKLTAPKSQFWNEVDNRYGGREFNPCRRFADVKRKALHRIHPAAHEAASARPDIYVADQLPFWPRHCG